MSRSIIGNGHDFVHQIEHILMVVLLIVFGGSLVRGLLNHLTWNGALVGLTLECAEKFRGESHIEAGPVVS